MCDEAPMKRSLKANNLWPSFNFASAKDASLELYLFDTTFSTTDSKLLAVKGRSIPSNLSTSGFMAIIGISFTYFAVLATKPSCPTVATT